MQERIRFVRDWQSGLYAMTELCERYQISREAGCEWLERFDAEGAAGLDVALGRYDHPRSRSTR